MKIVVAGTGYVGLVTGACLSEVGHSVTCVDIDENKVEKMKKGISPIYEPGLDELLKRNHDEGRLNFTIDYKSAYKDADLVFIGVGTPEREDGSANLDYVFNVCKQISDNIENFFHKPLISIVIVTREPLALRVQHPFFMQVEIFLFRPKPFQYFIAL